MIFCFKNIWNLLLHGTSLSQTKSKSYLKNMILDMYLIPTEIVPHKEITALHGRSNLQNSTQIQDHH